MDISTPCRVGKGNIKESLIPNFLQFVCVNKLISNRFLSLYSRECVICILEEAISEINERICKLENLAGKEVAAAAARSNFFFSVGDSADNAADRAATMGFDPMLLFNLWPRKTSLGEESYDSLVERVRR